MLIRSWEWMTDREREGERERDLFNEMTLSPTVTYCSTVVLSDWSVLLNCVLACEVNSWTVLEFDALEKKEKLKLFAQTCGCSRGRRWLIFSSLERNKGVAYQVSCHVVQYLFARAQYRDTNAEPSARWGDAVHCLLSVSLWSHCRMRNCASASLWCPHVDPVGSAGSSY